MRTSEALPDRITDYFIANIAAEKLLPNTKLPPYKALAAYLNVDVTSLRMALRVLIRMGLVTPVQGSGVTVNDYRKCAGLDFLDGLYQIKELDFGKEMLLQAFESFIALTPKLMAPALPKLSDEARLEYTTLVRQLQNAAKEGAPASELARLDVAMFDVVANELNNLYAQLAVNSSRTQRYRFTESMYELVNRESHVENLKRIFIGGMSGKYSVDQVEEEFRSLLVEAMFLLKKHVTPLGDKQIITQPILPNTPIYFEMETSFT